MAVKELGTLIEVAIEDIKKFHNDNPHLPINGFSDLHNYYDANCYVETLFKEDGSFMYREANLVNNALDNFIKQNLKTNSKWDSTTKY